MSTAATCLACGSTRDLPEEQRLTDLVAEFRRTLAVRDRQVDDLRAEVARLRGPRPAPAVPAKVEGCGCFACGDHLAVGGLVLPRVMHVCADCGNKRCPRATDHRDACTGSNEPGQAGSRYEGLS